MTNLFLNKGFVNALKLTCCAPSVCVTPSPYIGDAPKFFSTKRKNSIISTLKDNASRNIDNSGVNTINDPFILKFKKYTSNFNLRYFTSLKFKYINNFNFNPYFCTYDLETLKDSRGLATPYLFGLYIPNVGFNSFYGLNCVSDAVDFIFNLDYPYKKIAFYGHFAGGFDAYLIMNELIKRKASDKIQHLTDQNNNIFYIRIEHNNKIFEFKDSYKLMPIGLNKILEGFNIIVNDSLGKMPFKHSWVTSNHLNYIGEIPVWLLSYKDLLIKIGALNNNNEFIFKNYAIAYNEIDTVGLHKSVEKFFRILVDNFHIDFSHCITLPQLVMELYRKRYLDDDNIKIRLFSRNMQNLISKAYYGAHTSVYIPYGEKLYFYDINSLYPLCMLKDMPVGTPKKYDVNKGLNNLFGFAYVKVFVPESLKIPVLPVYAKIDGVEKLIFPTGTFKGYYFSEELRYAESLGCEIQLIEAWEFQKSNVVFKDFVEPLYELKRSGNKDERDVFKLCLNSLYGRMGQHREYSVNIITSDLNLMESIEKTFSNIKQNTISENVASYIFDSAPNPNLLKENPQLFNELHESFELSLESRVSNIAIAAAITAYGRIEIDKFKRLPGYTVYYSDTDCVILNKPLPKEFLGDDIGKMKNELSNHPNYTVGKDQEYYIEKGIFLRDKVYSLKTFDGKIITKFSGLYKDFITGDLYNTLESLYFNSGKNLKLSTLQTSKNKNTFEIKVEKIDKVFTFNYNKRIMVTDKNGVWVNTKPIHISSVKIQNYDLEPIIGRQNRQERNDRKIALNYKDIKINHNNVYNSDYKGFDGFFLNYSSGNSILNPPSNSLRSISNLLIDHSNPMDKAKNILLSNLQIVAEKAIEEDVLVDGSGYLITEEYITSEGLIKLNSISYLNTFTNLNELLNIYEQHLNGIIDREDYNGGILSFEENKDVIEEGNNYIINRLYLRVLIPKKLIKEKIVPAKFLSISSCNNNSKSEGKNNPVSVTPTKIKITSEELDVSSILVKRMNELIVELEKLEYHLDHIAWDKTKIAKSEEIYKEIRTLEEQTGVKYQVKVGTEWSSQAFDIEVFDDEDFD